MNFIKAWMLFTSLKVLSLNFIPAELGQLAQHFFKSKKILKLLTLIRAAI